MYKTLFDEILTEVNKEFFNLNTNNKLKYTIEEKDELYELQIQVAAYDKSDLVLETKNNEFIVSYDGKENFWKKKFKSVFKINDSIDTSKIEANMENGILYVKFPRLKNNINYISIK
jgi:HSP20 family molecular chaperone IbpA